MSKLKLTTLLLTNIVSALVFSGCAKKPVTQNTNVNTNSNEATTTATTKIQIINTTTTPNIDMSDWATYRNEQYGFEFKYPKKVNNKKINIYSNDGTKSLKDTIFGIAITPEELGYQDHMIVLNVINKNSKEMNDLLPSGVLPRQQQLIRFFQVGNKMISGYEQRSEYKDSEIPVFISQWLLIPGVHYDYYMNSGFFENTINLDMVIDGIIYSFKSF